MTQAYFTVPKILETDARYSSLSLGARYLYGHLRDTLKLSIMNNWRDEVGTYVKVARETMATFLHVSLPTVLKYIKELVKIGLIVDVRKGLTECNQIYVQLLDGESESDLVSRGKEDPNSRGKQGFTPDKKTFAANNRNYQNPNLNNHNSRVPWSKNLPKDHWWWENGEKVCWSGRTASSAYVGRYYDHNDLKHLIQEI